MSSSTFVMLTDVHTDLGRPLPTFLSALPVASICLNKLSRLLPDQSLVGNSFNSFFEPHFFSFN